MESILEVVSLRLRDVLDRVRDRRISLDVDDKAKEWLAQAGYSDAYGARAIARVVRTKVLIWHLYTCWSQTDTSCLQVLFPLAKKLLDGTIRSVLFWIVNALEANQVYQEWRHCCHTGLRGWQGYLNS